MVLQGPLLFNLFVILIFVCIREPLSTAQSTSTEVGLPVLLTTHVSGSNGTMYAWSTWGAWSSCSRSCGGGVAVQERQCLPRDPTRWRRSRKRRKLTRSVKHARRTRNIVTRPEPDCPGLRRRYHECNTTPCPGGQQDSRADQCAVYDRRPFRGRFYTWVPYVDGNAPCVLNCRPRGQQFYASLALVADGTPCTKPGYRAICVQGSCKGIYHGHKLGQISFYGQSIPWRDTVKYLSVTLDVKVNFIAHIRTARNKAAQVLGKF